MAKPKETRRNILVPLSEEHIEWLDNYHPELGRAAAIRTLIRNEKEKENN